MGKWAKFIGAGLGLAFIGPLGGVLGYVIGKRIDQESAPGYIGDGDRDYVDSNRSNLLFTNILGFMAAIVKADGIVKKSEISMVMASLQRMYSLDSADMSMARVAFDEMLTRQLNIRELSVSYNKYANKAMKLTLIAALFQVSYADGTFGAAEERMVNSIAGYLGLSGYEVRSIKAGFGYNERTSSTYTSSDELNKAYDILGISKEDSEDDIKKAYRKLVKQYHPDQFQGIDEVATKLASEKMTSINQAYNTIKTAKAV